MVSTIGMFVLGPFKDAIDVARCAPVLVNEFWSIRCKAAALSLRRSYTKLNFQIDIELSPKSFRLASPAGLRARTSPRIIALDMQPQLF